VGKTFHEHSVQSLLLQLGCKGSLLSTGTGFVVQSHVGPVLLTNRHVVTGRDPDTDRILHPGGDVPDEIVVIHNRANRLGEWIPRGERLYSPSGPQWKEHRVLGKRADFVALPLTSLDDVQLYPYSLEVKPPLIACGPADTVSVIGFPFGMQAGGSLAVWATGFIASELDIDYQDLPMFLIDCRSRPGQSGSAVVSYRTGGTVRYEGGNTGIGGGPKSRFLGIYSGRINAESDLGMVWKATALKELVDSL